MSNRIKKVKTKNAIKSLYETIFNTLKQNDLTIESKRFMDGYFIFEHGKDMVCHFKLKEMPDWKFGIWLHEDLKSYEIFGEHFDLIDKFKPSRCMSAESAEEFVEILKPLLNNPAKAFYYSLHDEFSTEEKMKAEYEGHLQEQADEKIIDEALEEKAFRVFKTTLFKQFPQIQSIGIKDGNTSGWISSPRYDVYALIDDEPFSDDELDKLMHQIYDFMRNEDSSFDTWLNPHRFSFRGFYYDKDWLYSEHCNWVFHRKNV